MHFSPFNLLAILESATFEACSNGSAVSMSSLYGWALSTKDRMQLAHGAGPGLVDGHDPHLFFSEGSGMLSVLCFICQLMQWTGVTTTSAGKLATKNKGFLKRIESQGTLKYSVPNKQRWFNQHKIYYQGYLHLT
jgi:hypothetical protein